MEKLYNNVLLADGFQNEPSYPRDIPYLKHPPEIINISVGRQLFVDDFLIAETDLIPVFHQAVKYEGNPVLSPETPWEKETGNFSACPKSGGVWYDEKERIFKMWYEAGWLNQMCYAVSADGIRWERPVLSIEPGTNKILLWKNRAEDDPVPCLRPDSCAVFIDDEAPADQRYKLGMHKPGSACPGVAATSPDGIHWENFTETGIADDRTTIFYNPFRKKWVYSIRSAWRSSDPRFIGDRRRDYIECDDLLEGAKWERSDRHPWMACCDFDTPDPYILHPMSMPTYWSYPSLYNVDCVGYESIMLGMFEIHAGLRDDNYSCHGVPKITDLLPMYSRDGYHFSRPSDLPLVWSSRYRGAWDRGYVQSVGGVCIVHGDELWIYYSGFAGDEAYDFRVSMDDNQRGIYKNGATGLAKLRRDGFVSMDGSGTLTTRLLEVSGKKTLHINAKGCVSAELLSTDGSLLASSETFLGDSTNAMLRFGDFPVESVNDSVFRIRFRVNGALYAFGFADETGDFGGAHAAGIVK